MSNNSSVSVKTSSTTVLAKNLSRKTAEIINDSDQTIYLALGAAAVMNKGIRLNAGGGAYKIDASNLWLGTVNAICTSGGKNLCFSETSKEAT